MPPLVNVPFVEVPFVVVAPLIVVAPPAPPLVLVPLVLVPFVAASVEAPAPLPPITPRPKSKPRMSPAKASNPSNAQQTGPQQLVYFLGASATTSLLS